MQDAVLLSIQVGRPRSYGGELSPDASSEAGTNVSGSTWRSAFAKQPVSGPVGLGRLQLDGDEQADTKHHGGPDKAVLAYAAAHYEAWAEELGRSLPFGGFGENFTIAGIDEGSVCIGDVYRVGEAEVEVSQPRFPCWKIERFWGIPHLTDLVRTSGRTGWYLRVRREGRVFAGSPIERLSRPAPEWTIARVNDLLHGRDTDVDRLRALLDLPWLATPAKELVAHRLRCLQGV
jgi:MOSC domain-containing protein YiiM